MFQQYNSPFYDINDYDKNLRIPMLVFSVADIYFTIVLLSTMFENSIWCNLSKLNGKIYSNRRYSYASKRWILSTATVYGIFPSRNPSQYFCSWFPLLTHLGLLNWNFTKTTQCCDSVEKILYDKSPRELLWHKFFTLKNIGPSFVLENQVFPLR